MSVVVAALTGLIFGCGLVISQMVNPAKVLGFLDLFGAWDPSLAVVMATAVPVAALGYGFAKRRGRSLVAGELQLPRRTEIDRRLILGSGLFGIGWGLVGFCPGPALTALGLGSESAALFVAAMIAGMALFTGMEALRARRTYPA